MKQRISLKGVMLIAVLLAVPVLFQNCMQNYNGSYSMSEAVSPLFPGTDTGNAGDGRMDRGIVAASSLASALCTRAEMCVKGLDFMVCNENLIRAAGFTELLGFKEFQNLEQLKLAELNRTHRADPTNVAACVDEIFAQPCDVLKGLTAQDLIDQSYQPLHSWVTGSCLHLYTR